MYLVILVVLVSVSWAADPQPCCMPARYSGVLIQTGGVLKENSTTGNILDDTIEMHYDYNKQMTALVSHRRNVTTGLRENTTIIYDYKNGRYHILPMDGKCYTKQLDSHSMINPCIIVADNFTYGSSFTIGSAVKQFRVNTFDGMLRGLEFSLVVTDDCIPVADKRYGDQGRAKTVMAFLFTEVDKNGVNDAMFAVPSICQASITATGVGRRDLEALNLHRLPFS